MKIIMIICGIVCGGIYIITLNGCSTLIKPFTVESPRPNKEQIAAAQHVSEQNVPVIANMQTDKQQKIMCVARAALRSIEKATGTPQVEGITNIAANAIEGIQLANGTAKILGAAYEKTSQDILRMSVAEYGIYAASQGIVASHNIGKAKEGIKAGWEWTKSTLATIIGGGTGGLGLIGFATMMARRAMERRKLLVATGGVIETFSSNHPAEGQELKNNLATAHSSIPVNAKEEFKL